VGLQQVPQDAEQFDADEHRDEQPKGVEQDFWLGGNGFPVQDVIHLLRAGMRMMSSNLTPR
jgi:hypothetical protein